MSREGNPKIQITVALIAAIAVVVSAYLALKAAREPVILAIEATQTAETRLTSDAIEQKSDDIELTLTTKTPDSIISTPTFVLSNTDATAETPVLDVTVSSYDDFDDMQYDNSYNLNLWEYEGTRHIDVEQVNGVLVFSTNSFPESANGRMSPIYNSTWSLENLPIIEAKLQLDSSKRGQGSFIKIITYTELSGRDWWSECMLNNGEYEYTFFFCDIYSGERTEDDMPVYEYQTSVFNGNYDEWYTARIEIDAETIEFSFYLNGKLIGSHVPKDAEELQQASFSPSIGSWANSDEQFLGYFDDVRFDE